MARPTNTIGDRDYGRRYYASKKKYEEQRKLISDAHADRIAGWKEKHSEFKKPYLPDLSYPEMEMYNPPPWNPIEPVIPPGEPPTIGPVEPGGPVKPPKEPPPGELPPFLGCMFFSRRIRPSTLKPGQLAYGGVDIGAQDSISAINIYGPGTLGVDIAGCNATTKYKFSGYKEQSNNRGFCGISVKAKDNPKDFNHVTPYFTIGQDSPGPYPIVVEVRMASGAVCTEMLWVNACPAVPEFEYDWDVSAQTIVPAGSYVLVAVKNGFPPYTWSLSGAGFQFYGGVAPRGQTALIGALGSACGACNVTVVDSCGTTVAGHLRTTTGSWYAWSVDPRGCNLPGEYALFDSNSGNHVLWINIKGKYKQREDTQVTQGASIPCASGEIQCADDNGGQNCYTICSYSGSLCDHYYGWECGSCMDQVGSPNMERLGGNLVWYDNWCDRFMFQCGTFNNRECYCILALYAYEWSCP